MSLAGRPRAALDSYSGYCCLSILWSVSVYHLRLLKRIYPLLAISTLLAACVSAAPTDPATAQITAQTAWDQGWHGIWELTWSESPISGSIVFEGWRTKSGQEQRFEILEASVPKLVGLVYINDGKTGQYFNRLEPADPATISGPTLSFSPLSDAFAQITRLLTEPPQSARQRALALPQGPGLQLTFIYPHEQILTLWLDTTNDLILKVSLESPSTHLNLIARTLEPLSAPHPDLFKK